MRCHNKRVEALLLSWVKYEKQLSCLFYFLVFQHPSVTNETIESMVTVLANDNQRYPETFVRGIDALNVRSVRELMGAQYEVLYSKINRIRAYRNKLMRGQITGQRITSRQIERDVAYIINWATTLATAAVAEFGYDGVGRDTFRSVKSAKKPALQDFPFGNTD